MLFPRAENLLECSRWYSRCCSRCSAQHRSYQLLSNYSLLLPSLLHNGDSWKLESQSLRCLRSHDEIAGMVYTISEIIELLYYLADASFFWLHHHTTWGIPGTTVLDSLCTLAVTTMVKYRAYGIWDVYRLLQQTETLLLVNHMWDRIYMLNITWPCIVWRNVPALQI